MSLFNDMLDTIKKWTGKKVDYDKAYGYQCVDYARQYASDIGYPIGTFSGSALNGWKTGSPFKGKWTRVAYIKGKVPARGSIIFFDKTLQNPYGHVAIVQTADITSVTVSEQNAGSGTGNGVGTNAVTTRKYPYAKAPVGNVLGWYELP